MRSPTYAVRTTTILLLVVAAALATSTPTPPRSASLPRRSNPNGAYNPSTIDCPAPSNGSTNGFIRDARNATLSPEESAYITAHRQGAQSGWQSWLTAAGLDGDGGIAGGVSNYTSTLSNLPRVGLAVSGGGFRAMLYGTGVLQGLDGRNQTAIDRKTAGLLQLADYAAGLSGGSWGVGSLAINDWRTTSDLLNNVWNLEEDLIVPQDNALPYYTDIVFDVAQKRVDGYPTGIVDYWGRALSYHLLDNNTYIDEGQGTTFSDIRNVSSYKNASYPFPIVISDEREAGELLIETNTTIFEFTPIEMGSWDNNVSAFIPIDILGSELNNGVSKAEDGKCVAGFDNFGWVVGTSSTLFNALYNQLITTKGSSIIKEALEAVLRLVSQQLNDVSVVTNPFFGFRNGTSRISTLSEITLVDAGEDNQNVPLWPLLQPARNLDLILAIDGSADVSGWPNGSALWHTSLRSADYPLLPVPVMPPPETFVNRGLNTRPTFFGCNATNATNAATAQVLAPIIVYLPNYPYSGLGNTSTFKLGYGPVQSATVVDNAVQVATLGGAASDWPACLGCAMLERSFSRSGVPRPAQCTACLNKYCWDGTQDNTPPANPYSPPVGTPEFVTSNGTLQQTPPFTGGTGANPGANDTASEDFVPGGNETDTNDGTAANATSTDTSASANATSATDGARAALRGNEGIFVASLVTLLAATLCLL